MLSAPGVVIVNEISSPMPGLNLWRLKLLTRLCFARCQSLMVKLDSVTVGYYETNKYFMSALLQPLGELLSNLVVAPGVSSPSLAVHLGD